jgi:hypothetical protein
MMEKFYLELWFSGSISKKTYSSKKIFWSNIFMKICPRLSLRKWFYNSKKISTTIINQNKEKLLFELCFSISISEGKYIPVKKFQSKIEEMILQQ